MFVRQLAITSISYDKAISNAKINLFDLFEMVKREFKLNAIEIEHKHFKSGDLDYLQKIKSKAEACNLEIINIGLENNYGMATKEEREKEFEKFKRCLNIPKILDVPFTRILSGSPMSTDPNLWDEMISYVRESCLLAKEEGILLLMEHENHHGFAKDAQTTLRIFQEVNQDNLRLLLDTGSYIDGIPSIEKTLHLAAHIHAKFLKVDKEGNEINIDYKTIFDLLKKRGYKGYISVEYEGEEDEFTAVPRAIARIKRYLCHRQ